MWTVFKSQKIIIMPSNDHRYLAILYIYLSIKKNILENMPQNKYIYFLSKLRLLSINLCTEYNNENNTLFSIPKKLSNQSLYSVKPFYPNTPFFLLFYIIFNASLLFICYYNIYTNVKRVHIDPS